MTAAEFRAAVAAILQAMAETSEGRFVRGLVAYVRRSVKAGDVDELDGPS